MSEAAKKLVQSFKAKEEIDGFLSNLQQLKADGTVDEDYYATLKSEYDLRLNSATSEISQIKSEIRKQLETVQHDIETNKQELSNLDIKYKVGELTIEQFQDSERKLRAKINQLEQEVENLNKLIHAKSSADIDITDTKPKAAAPIASAPSPSPPPTEPPATTKGIKLPKGKLLAIIGGAVAVIAVVILIVVLGGGKKTGPTPAQYETIDIPVTIQSASNVGSLHFEMAYDSGALRAIDVQLGTVSTNAILEYSADAPEQVIVGIISSSGINGNGQLAIVTFEVLRDNATSTFSLGNIIAHDATSMTEITTATSAGSLTTDGNYIAPVLLFTSAGN